MGSLAEQKFYNREHIEEATSRLVGKIETSNELVPYLYLAVENLGKYFDCGAPFRKARGPGPTLGSPAKGSSAEKRSPHNFWL